MCQRRKRKQRKPWFKLSLASELLHNIIEYLAFEEAAVLRVDLVEHGKGSWLLLVLLFGTRT